MIVKSMIEEMKEKQGNLIKWDYFVITLFVITSGALFWHGLSPAMAFILFFIVSLCHSRYMYRDFIPKRNTSYLFIYVVIIICVLNYLFYDVQFKDNSTIGYFVCLVGTYLVISRYDFYYFRRLLTNIIYVITLFGLIVFLLSELGEIPVYILVPKSGVEYTMCLIYTLGWPDLFHRFSGIWHEPGACQIILNTVLWLHFDNICSWNWEKGLLKKCAIILIGSLATLSTGSYMVIMLLAVSVLFNIKLNGKYRFVLSLLLVIIAPIVIYILFNSPVIQNKLFDAEGESVSKIERLSDINALWKMTLERPFLGYGIGSVVFWEKSDAYGNTACSSGILTYSASLGFTWLVAFAFFLWKAIKKMKFGKASFLLFLAVIIMQFNEKFIEYPITSIFIFTFYSYNKTNYYAWRKKNNYSDGNI